MPTGILPYIAVEKSQRGGTELFEESGGSTPKITSSPGLNPSLYIKPQKLPNIEAPTEDAAAVIREFK